MMCKYHTERTLWLLAENFGRVRFLAVCLLYFEVQIKPIPTHEKKKLFAHRGKKWPKCHF